MAIAPTNATGWTQLYDGNIVGAAWVMFNNAWAGWVIAILFVVFQLILYLKTRNPMLYWITGMVILLVTSTYIIATVFWVIFGILVFELVAILYTIFWK